MKQKIIEEIKKYSPHSEKLTLSTLLALNQKIHICNIGASGIGKSRNTVELLKLLNIPNDVVAGHVTPKAFFNILKKDGIIVVDEGATILSDRIILNLLLNALWNGKVEWINGRETNSHHFKGQIIFNTNKLGHNELSDALRDRIFTNELSLSSLQIMDKISSAKTYKPNIEIWANIKDRVFRETELSEQHEELVYHLIQQGEPKSVRDIWKLKRVARFSLSLVGDLSLMEYFIETDEMWSIINLKIKRSEKVKKIAELKCITERGARKIISKFENG